MPRFKCVCSAVAVAMVVGMMVLLVDLAALSGPTYFPGTSSLANGWEVLANPRLILQELPTSSLLLNNEVTFTDAQFGETVEAQYNKIISSQKWLRQRVDWEERNLQKAPEVTFDTGSQELTVTLFSAPPAFTGSESDLNRQALLSWLHLSPRPQVVLLGNHSSLHQVAAEFPGLVTVEPNIDYSFTGLPMFHSMVARANAVTTNVTVLVPPTVMLLQDFMPGLRKLAATFPSEWAMVAQRLEISDLPFRFVHKGGGIVFLEHSVTGESMIDREMASFVRTSGKLSLLEGVNVWAWTVASDEPLFAAPMPSFTYGAGYHDQWMARALAQAGSRIVVDATDALVGFHVRGQQNQAAPEDAASTAAVAANVAAKTSKQTQTHTPTPTTLFWNVSGMEWHNIANLYLYRIHRDIVAEEKALLGGAGWKLIGCPEPSMIKLCISETHSAANPCRCRNVFSRPVSGSRYAETFLEKEARLRLEVIDVPALGTSSIEYFHSLAQLLSQVADNAMKDVVLVGVTFADKEMLWSFMCRARALGVTNVLVAAFDQAVYKAALVRGLPVFYAGAPAASLTEDVQVETTKLKVQVVVQVLQQGFNVLWSDVDVVWFQNPLPRVAAYKTGTLVVASNEPNMHLPGNGGGRVNAGFFYAQANRATMHTFQDLVRYAGGSQPEQVLFSQVLCGRGAQRRAGATECTAPNGLRTSFLDRRTFANGLVHGYWEHPNVTQVATSNGVYVLHNNWIHETDNKVRRQKAKRVWFYNDAARMCVHPWQQPPR
jgi:hypothetical protein